jgi:hypothetical protein
VTPLEELRVLLGVGVADVRQIQVTVNGRPLPDPNAWPLELHRARFGLKAPPGSETAARAVGGAAAHRGRIAQAPPRPRQRLFETCPCNARGCENVMNAIQIIQLCPAPEGWWRFHAIHADTDGDAIVYISRVVALALVDDEHDPGNPVRQRVVPIDADAMTYDLGLYDRVKPPESWWSTEAVHAADLAEALELAEKWMRQEFSRALADHDFVPVLRSAGIGSWQMVAGRCSEGCARCTVEHALDEKFMTSLVHPLPEP